MPQCRHLFSLPMLARHSGVRCTQGYVAVTSCSPARAGLMTGGYPTRFGHETNQDHNSSGGRTGQKAATQGSRYEIMRWSPQWGGST